MQQIFVKDLMVPLAEYATVDQDATLYDAVLALENAQKAFSKSNYQHRAVLVLNKDKEVVGKISQMDIMRSLEPKYDLMGEGKPLAKNALSRFGFSRDFLKSLIKQYNLWDDPLDELCRKSARTIKVRDFMYSLTENEYVRADATLHEAVHQLVMGHHQSLLVTENEKIVGILRLTDVFTAITGVIHQCIRKDA